MNNGRMTAEEKKWQAESDLNTLTRAAEIQANKNRLAAAKKVASDQVKNLQKVTGSGAGAKAKPAAKKPAAKRKAPMSATRRKR